MGTTLLPLALVFAAASGPVVKATTHHRLRRGLQDGCPLPDVDVVCRLNYDPVDCGGCEYSNDCFAEAAGWFGCTPLGTVCPPPPSDVVCTANVNPVECGSDRCVYDNECLANAAGFVSCTPLSVDCPLPGAGLCTLELRPVQCGDNNCQYDNACLAEKAGFDVDDDCTSSTPLEDCPAPSGGFACGFIYLPVLCDDRCEYDNDCLANAAGFTDCRPTGAFCPSPPEDTRCDNLPFPVAPSDLARYCDVGEMEELGTQHCQDACAPAECCWKVGEVNCAATVPNNMCEPYARACLVLNYLSSVVKDDSSIGRSRNSNNPAARQPSDGIDEIPPAPIGLDVYCNPSEMEEINFQICHDKCSQAQCCWRTGVEVCPSSVAVDTCRPYAEACAILNNLLTYPNGNINNGQITSNNSNVPQAPSDFATRCSRENIMGSSDGGIVLIQCEQECLEASCCWQPNSVEPCTTNSRCLDYEEPCSLFVGLFSSIGDTGDVSPAEVSPVQCGPFDDCLYDNLCWAIAAGWEETDCTVVVGEQVPCNPTTTADCPPPPLLDLVTMDPSADYNMTTMDPSMDLTHALTEAPSRLRRGLTEV